MQKDFIEYIQKQELFETNQQVLLTISGGIDSSVMFDLFLKTQKYSFGVAHCNFGLRNKEADKDEEFVRQLCQKNQIPFYTKLFDTKTYAEKHKVSIQMAARDLRYAWFEEILRTKHYHLIATAHHKNDVLETVLLNLTHGTGIAGLHGILPKNKNIVRPLLFASKIDIEDYAKENNIEWREDASNAEDKYERNLIRNQVVPVLKKLNPNLENTFSQTVEKLGQTESVFLTKVKEIAKTACKKIQETYFIDLAVFEEIDNSLIILYQVLQKFGFSYLQTQEIWLKREEQSGKIFETKNFSLVKDRKQLVIANNISTKNITHLIFKNQQKIDNLFLTLDFEEIIVDKNFEIDKNPNIAYLDLAKLKFPLKLRVWQEGEKFYPLGMKNQKKISDFLINAKIPLNLKNRVFVLLSDNKITWLVGQRIDNRFKITSNTKKVLKIYHNFQKDF